jgi:hypothetical protein
MSVALATSETIRMPDPPHQSLVVPANCIIAVPLASNPPAVRPVPISDSQCDQQKRADKNSQHWLSFQRNSNDIEFLAFAMARSTTEPNSKPPPPDQLIHSQQSTIVLPAEARGISSVGRQ